MQGGGPPREEAAREEAQGRAAAAQVGLHVLHGRVPGEVEGTLAVPISCIPYTIHPCVTVNLLDREGSLALKLPLSVPTRICMLISACWQHARFDVVSMLEHFRDFGVKKSN